MKRLPLEAWMKLMEARAWQKKRRDDKRKAWAVQEEWRRNGPR